MKPVVSSCSDTSLNAMLGIPMLTPGMLGAPKFKGKRVSDFLDVLKQHADSARVHTCFYLVMFLDIVIQKLGWLLARLCYCLEMTGLQ